jgi:hypothetical protein
VQEVLGRFKKFTSKFGLWWPIVLVPIYQEFLFRYLPYRFLFLPFGFLWEIGIVTNLIFAACHWYFGRWFMVWAFFWGMVSWLVIAEFGLLGSILLH